MAFFSLLRRLNWRFREQPRAKKRLSRLSLENLEARDLLSGGPVVVATTPTTAQSPPLTTVTVSFNEAVNVNSFNLAGNQQARTSAAFQLASSTEGLTNRASDLISTYLHRAASPAEAAAYGGLLTETLATAQAGGSANADADVVSRLVASAEYFTAAVNNAPTGTQPNQAWLSQVYLDLLGRLPNGTDPTAAQLSTLNTNPGIPGRLMVAHGMTGTLPGADPTLPDQYERNLIAGLENQFLGTNISRPAPANDPNLNALVNLLDNAATTGATVQGLEAVFLAGVPYYANDGEVVGGAANQSQALQTGSTLSALAYGDFSGALDAHGQLIPDLAVIDRGTGTVKIYQGRPGGGFNPTPTVVLNLPAGSGATALVVGDFDGRLDSNNNPVLDIAVANTGMSAASGQSVSVFMNITASPGGPITFDARQDYNGGDKPTGIVAADVDGDGKMDLAVVDSALDGTNKYDLNLLLGNATIGNTFSSTPTTIAIGAQTPGPGDITSPTGLAVANFDVSNPLPGLAVSGSNGLVLLLNSSTAGSPSFVLPANRLTNTPTTSVATGTLDHSGAVDIVATTDTSGGQVLVFQNNGASPPQFTNSYSFAAGSTPRAVNVADLNGDGLGDIAVVNDIGAGTLTVLRNTTTFKQGGGETITFAPAVAYSSLGANPVALALADTNQDRMLDAAVASSTPLAAGGDTFAVIPGMTPGTFRTSSDAAWLQGVYQQLFHRPADPAAFTGWMPVLAAGAQAYFQGPNGSVSPLSVTALDPSNQNFQLTFASQVLDGKYTLNLKGVTDPSGNPMTPFSTPFAVNTSDDGRFVSGLYHDLLGIMDPGGLNPADSGGRQADNVGFAAFVGIVDPARATAIAQVTPAFSGSKENIDNNINTTFLHYLRRPAGASDFAAWEPVITSGVIPEQTFSLYVVGSAEYFMNEGGGLNAGWVNQMYLDVLGRPDTGDPAALNFINYLNANSATPGQAFQARVNAASGFVFSAEGLSRVVYNTFVTLLDRAPTAAETQQYNALLGQGGVQGQQTPYERFEAALVSSPEFFATNGNTVKTWATALYARLLQRPVVDPAGPEVTGVTQLVLNQPGFMAARQTVINTLLSSAEYVGRVVTYDFVTYLKRTPSMAEIAGYVAATPPPGQSRDDFILSLILSGPEYSGALSNAAWLSKVYGDVYNRPVDGGTSNPDLLALNNGASRMQVALTILTRLEGRRDLVAGLFDRYLDRSKTLPQTGNDTEVNAYANLMVQSGFTQEQVAGLLLPGTEFFLDPHSYP
jgi:hypothetical protein